MAIYHCSVKPIQRSAGRSATAAAAYRSGTEIIDVRTGQRHDYTRRGGVLSAEIITPDTAPAWARERMELWNRAEAAEKRKDARVAREIEVSLPHELDGDARVALARGYAHDLAARYGVAVDLAIHAPHRKGDQRNHHVHFLLTTRALEPEGFAKGKADLELSNRARKARGLQSCEDALKAERAAWAAHVNQALERAGRAERVDHRSYEERGVAREATQHMGPTATKIEREGRRSRIGERNRQTIIWNRDLYEARQQMAMVDAAIREEKARLAAEKERRAAKGRTERAGGTGYRAPPQQAAAPERGGIRMRIDEWANRLRAQRQSAQLDETRTAEAGLDRERCDLEGELDAFYGPGLRSAREDLADVEKRLSGRLSRRKREAAEQQAEALRQTIATIEQRQAEQRGAQAARHREELERLRAHQAAQRRADEARIAQGPRAGPVKDRQPVPRQTERAASPVEAFKAQMRADQARKTDIPREPPVNDNAPAPSEDERASLVEEFKAQMRAQRQGPARSPERGPDYER